MKFTNQGDITVVSDYSYIKCNEVVLGTIEREELDDGYYHFYPEHKTCLTCRQLRDVAAKLAEMNRG